MADSVRHGLDCYGLDLVPHRKSLLSSASQDSPVPESLSLSAQDAGPLRNGESGTESFNFADASLSLDAAPSPRPHCRFKRLTKASKLHHSDGVPSQKSELERELEPFNASERDGHPLTSLHHSQNNACSTSQKSSNSVESVRIDWDNGTREPFVGRGRSKRGRQSKLNEQLPMKEEDVCFACLDGGNLIMCDKRNCPKAYHVECTGRKSDFFLEKGQWLCGWHVCASCSRSIFAQCYMCPNAYCSCCDKKAKFLHIRKGKGLCDMCYDIVYMIEHDTSTYQEGFEIDFSDKETYEYLFKHYWKELKQKLSITWSEINKAYRDRDERFDGGCHKEYRTARGKLDRKRVSRYSQRPRRKRGGKNLSSKYKSCSDYEEEEEQENEASAGENEENDNDDGEEEEEGDDWDGDGDHDHVIVVDGKNLSKPQKGWEEFEQTKENLKFSGWASDELVSFLRSIKEDFNKPMTLNSLNKIMLRYIDVNKLSSRPGHIRCDEKLQRLFGKKNVGKFQVMKLLTKHVASTVTEEYKGCKNLGNCSGGMESGNVDNKGQKQCMIQEKLGDAMQVESDFAKYASINVNNIGLIYLKRSLLEGLQGDPQFESKVTGAFVRIRVPSMVKKNETCYRLVQIVGIKQAQNPHFGGRVILEILNLQKREEITIDLVSSQDFTEEECQTLRQSFKCGLLSPLTVGELQEKARLLHEVKVKERFDMELLRLRHLCDRASEKGHKKELRLCVERLQALSSPSELERQLMASIEVNSDASMDPNHKLNSDVELMQKVQGTVKFMETSHGRRQWEKNFGLYNSENRSDDGGWSKSISHSGKKVWGDCQKFEKEVQSHVPGKQAQSQSNACDNKALLLKIGRREGIDSYPSGLSLSNKTVELQGVNGSNEKFGWETIVVSTNIENLNGSKKTEEERGVKESVGKGHGSWEGSYNLKEEKTGGQMGNFTKGRAWDGFGHQSKENGVLDSTMAHQRSDGWENSGAIKSNDGLDSEGVYHRNAVWESNRGIKSKDGLDSKCVNQRNSGRENSGCININQDRYGPLECGSDKTLVFKGTVSLRSDDDDRATDAADRQNHQGWGGNRNDDECKWNAGGKMKNVVWECNMDGNSQDDGWGWNVGCNNKDDVGWGGNGHGNNKGDGLRGNVGFHCEDDSRGGNMCAQQKNAGWGGNPSVQNNDDGPGHIHMNQVDPGWGNNAGACRDVARRDNLTVFKDENWRGCTQTQSMDDVWGDQEGARGNRSGGVDSSKMGVDTQDYACVNNAKGVEIKSSWRDQNASLSKREAFTQADTRPLYRDQSPRSERREACSGGSLRPSYRESLSQQNGISSNQTYGGAIDVLGGVLGGRDELTINFDKQKIWYYEDPSKTIQGPFSMEQLRKWERTKLFPLDLQVWRGKNSQDESILLTDALLGRYCDDLPPGFGHNKQQSQSFSCKRCVDSEDMRQHFASTSIRSGSRFQGNVAASRWDEDNARNTEVPEIQDHPGDCDSAEAIRLSTQDVSRDGPTEHLDWGTNSKAQLCRTGHEICSCRHFGECICKRGDQCDFHHRRKA